MPNQLQRIARRDDDGCGLLHAKKLSLQEAAKLIGVGETKLREIVHQGRIPVIRLDGKIVILAQDADTFLRTNYGYLKPMLPVRRPNELPAHIEQSDLFKPARRTSA